MARCSRSGRDRGARRLRPGRVRGAQLAFLASAGSGVGTRRGAALSTGRARALSGRGNSAKSSSTEESRISRADCVPKPTSTGGFRAQLLDTPCRVNSCVTHSKQRIGVHITRHTIKGGRVTEFSPHLGGAPTFRSRRQTAIGPVAAINAAQRSAFRATFWKGCPTPSAALGTSSGGRYESKKAAALVQDFDCVALQVPAGLVAEPGEDRTDAGLRFRLVVEDVELAVLQQGRGEDRHRGCGGVRAASGDPGAQQQIVSRIQSDEERQRDRRNLRALRMMASRVVPISVASGMERTRK